MCTNKDFEIQDGKQNFFYLLVNGCYFTDYNFKCIVIIKIILNVTVIVCKLVTRPYKEKN